MANFAQKFKNMWNPPEDEFEYEETETVEKNEPAAQDTGFQGYEDISSNSYSAPASSYEEPETRTGGNVVNFSSGNNVQVVLFKPMDYRQDTREIADELVQQHTVVLNLEVTPKDVARRVLDFLGGVAYAKNGKVKRVSTSTYIITPHNVDLVTGEVEDAEGEEV